jgi:hypothetical protein
MNPAASIPTWNNDGVLPPIRPNVSGNDADRSPYRVELFALIEHFASSPERLSILDGLLRFRADLHQAGIVSGFQWLDGSFMERIEVLESRAPRDMDVVTFFRIPEGHDQHSLVRDHGRLFDRKHVKETYAIDAYVCILGKPLDEKSVKQVSYWYSMWSHRRNGLWKGFIQVDLDPAQDTPARASLNLNRENRHDA